MVDLHKEVLLVAYNPRLWSLDSPNVANSEIIFWGTYFARIDRSAPNQVDVIMLHDRMRAIDYLQSFYEGGEVFMVIDKCVLEFIDGIDILASFILHDIYLYREDANGKCLGCIFDNGTIGRAWKIAIGKGDCGWKD